LVVLKVMADLETGLGNRHREIEKDARFLAELEAHDTKKLEDLSLPPGTVYVLAAMVAWTPQPIVNEQPLLSPSLLKLHHLQTEQHFGQYPQHHKAQIKARLYLVHLIPYHNPHFHVESTIHAVNDCLNLRGLFHPPRSKGFRLLNLGMALDVTG